MTNKSSKLEKLLLATGLTPFILGAADGIYHLATSSLSHPQDIYLGVAVALGTATCFGSILLSARNRRRRELSNSIQYANKTQ